MNFNKFTDRFREHFRDSYGFDRLSKYMLIAGGILLAINFSPMLGVIFIGYSAFRTFSKNKYRRYQELSTFEHYLSLANQKFGKYKFRLSNPGKQRFNLHDLKKYRFKLHDFKHFKVLKCPNCTQKLRVPRKQGKIVITCKACRTEFRAKS